MWFVLLPHVVSAAPARSIATFLCLGLLSSGISGSVLRVKAGSTAPAPDGLTWETAFPTLEAAGGAALAGDEVWVAAGSYAGSLTLPQEVAYYGGFAGMETERAQRNPADRSAVLTKPVELRALPEERPDKVTTVDGFRVTAGLALAIQTSFTLSNCDIEGQGLTIVGTGVVAKSVGVSDCRFAGASIQGQPENEYHIAGCSTTNGSLNLTSSAGGIIVEDCSVTGGDINLYSGKRIHLLRNQVFGGTIVAQSVNDFLIDRNLVAYGGGIVALGLNTTTVIGAVSNNVVAFCASPFDTSYGGLWAFHHLNVTGNTVVGCRAPWGALSIGSTGGDSPNAANNIVAFNDGPGVLGAGGGNIWTANCVFANSGGNYGFGDDLTGTLGNFSADPLFTNLSWGDWRLSPLSPCRDAGATLLAEGALDIDGQPRVQGGIVDIGAAESAFGKTWHVRQTAPGPDHDGLSWETAFTHIIDAVAASSPQDIIRVASGAYSYSPLMVKQGTALIGGYGAEAASLGDRDPARYGTTIAGGLGLEAVGAAHPEWTTVIDGFTLQDGGVDTTVQTSLILARCTFNDIPLKVTGETSATCLATGCQFTGGGPYARADGFGHCVFEKSRFDGVGPWAGGANAVVRDCIVNDGSIEVRSEGPAWAQRNTVTRGSITVYSTGWPELNCLADANVVIDSLQTGIAPLAVIFVAGSGAVSNNLVRHATLDMGAGIGVTHAIDIRIVNNTVVNCLNVGAGQAFHVVCAGNVEFSNNIASWNVANHIVVETVETTTVEFRSNCFHDATFSGNLTDPTGTNGNIDVDPLLDADGHLTLASPCINAGSTSDACGDADFEGDPRISGGKVDIGADESVAPAFSLMDVRRALRIAGGVTEALPGDLRRLDVVGEAVASKRVRIEDAVRLARKVAGLEPNP